MQEQREHEHPHQMKEVTAALPSGKLFSDNIPPLPLKTDELLPTYSHK